MKKRKSPKVICQICGKGFRSESGFRWHRENIHEGKGTPQRVRKEMTHQEFLFWLLVKKLDLTGPEEEKIFQARMLTNIHTLRRNLRIDGNS